jgi:hypothetical protein
MPSCLIRQRRALDETGERTLEMAMKRMSLSARAHDRILKVARTIAALDDSASGAAKHIAEAIQYSIWHWAKPPAPHRQTMGYTPLACADFWHGYWPSDAQEDLPPVHPPKHDPVDGQHGRALA